MKKTAVTLLTLLSLAACAPESAPPPAAVVPPAPEETAPAETPAPKPEPPKPARLTGLNPREVQALIGEPSLVRRDDSVQVMLFENQRCVLEVVFFEETPDDYFRANSVKARSRQGDPVDAAACLANILPDGQWRDSHD